MQYPAFIENEEYFQLDDSKSYHEQLIALTNNIKRLHQLSIMQFDSFEILMQSYLKSGIEIFQMSTGIVSNIVDGKDYIVKDIVSNIKAIRTGDVFELEGTYCKEVVKSKKILGFPHVGTMKEFQSHPAYVNLKLESYLSAPIFVRDVLYGTLNFSSTTPRQNGFSEHEHDLISMMADSIGNYILLKQKRRALERLIITDPLTTLHNRRYFDEIYTQKRKEALRSSDQWVLIMLDVDNFKKYNDRYGHAAGDDALMQLGQVLKKTLKRDTDYIFRIGGEEFAVIMEVKDEQNLKKILNMILANVKALNIEHIDNGSEGVFSISMGVAYFNSSKQSTDLEDVYKNADRALYEVKESKRGEYRIFNKH